jgi:hypothetical protein
MEILPHCFRKTGQPEGEELEGRTVVDHRFLQGKFHDFR